MIKSKPLVLVFDVNETLLDTAPLKKKVNALLKNEQGFRIWFTTMLQYSLVDTAVRQYHDFPEIAGATMDMAAAALGTEVKEDDKKDALGLITQLPAHPDVKPALQQLKDAGFRLITLTNSPQKTLDKQLAFAGLTGYFEQALSVDAVQLYKPAPETYRYAAEKTGVNAAAMMMVAAHGWDMTGAIAAGMQTAFVEREGQSLYALSPEPTMRGKDLLEITTAVLTA